jgi:hypothetical protein
VDEGGQGEYDPERYLDRVVRPLRRRPDLLPADLTVRYAMPPIPPVPPVRPPKPAGKVHALLLVDDANKDTGVPNKAGAALLEKLLREGLPADRLGVLVKEIVGLDPGRNTSLLKCERFELSAPYLPGHFKGDRVTVAVRAEDVGVHAGEIGRV